MPSTKLGIMGDTTKKALSVRKFQWEIVGKIKYR